uniref:Nuclear protein MDM1 n=1 Tax=Moschus moschiferus TaxID=68415 RepID=A0A8C6E711_MOSMO|nr:nuclear protein MDM1 isoform X4 [Odocoileus virginianus texanus]
MPVRFKGLSEYQRNFLWKKSYLSESCNSSVGRRHPWAGLRSDQLGTQGRYRAKIQHNDISSLLILVCTA